MSSRSSSHAEPEVVVVGAGWAGLAAAVALARRGVAVHVVEAAAQPGGRARTLNKGAQCLDNGQHLLAGAYQAILRLLGWLGIREERVLLRRPLQLDMRGDNETLLLKTASLPAPSHLLTGLATSRGLSMSERLRALRFAEGALRQPVRDTQDVSVDTLLDAWRQPQRVRTGLWQPLCIAALNTPPERASARIFIQVLREIFTGPRDHSDLLFPRVPLGSVFPEPAVDYVSSRGGSVNFGTRVTDLDIKNGAVRGLQWQGGQQHPTPRVILAVPAPMAHELLSAHPAACASSEGLASLSYEPISTVYLRYPSRIRLPGEMLGLLGTQAQWVFDRRVCDQPGLLAAVISTGGPHMESSKQVLGETVADELTRRLEGVGNPTELEVVREKRATFASTVGVDGLRLGTRTPVAGLYLAGEHTATGLPGTLEGAVRSGLSAAQAVMADR